MSKKIKIEKITVSIGKKIVELTPEEVKTLKYQLDNLLVNDNVYWYPVYPYYQYYPQYTTNPQWTYTTEGSTISMDSSETFSH